MERERLLLEMEEFVTSELTIRNRFEGRSVLFEVQSICRVARRGRGGRRCAA